MKQRTEIISAALDSHEGRSALAAAMAAPINNSIIYQNIGRKLLIVDESSEQYSNIRKDVSEYMNQWLKQ